MPAVLVALVLVVAAAVALALDEPGGVVALVGGALVWLVVDAPFAGPVLVTVAPGHGVHAGDLPALAALAVAAVASWRIRRHRQDVRQGH